MDAIAVNQLGRAATVAILAALALGSAATTAHGKDRIRPKVVSAHQGPVGVVTLRFSEPIRLRSARAFVLMSSAGRAVGTRSQRKKGAARKVVVYAKPATSVSLAKVRWHTGAVRDRRGNAIRGNARPMAQPSTPVQPIVEIPPAPRPIQPPATKPPAPGPVTPPDTMPALTPIEGSALRDSIGVNVHMSYFDSAYNSFTTIKSKLLKLGVGHVRDGACAGCTEQQNRLRSLGAAGIGLNLIMGRPGIGDTVEQNVAMVESRLAPYVESLEGANEYDVSGDSDWANQLRAHQQELYSRVRASSVIADVPVFGPSLVQAASYATLGDLGASSDCASIHPYAGGDVPDAALAADMDNGRTISRGDPVCVTESGYHNAVTSTSDHRPTSEAAVGSYMPRLYLDYFKAGVPRSFTYELVDEWSDADHNDLESNFGLLRNDYSEKPAFRSLEDLIALTQSTGAPDGRAIRVQATGPGLRQMLLQRGPQDYVLLLWRNVRTWNPAARSDITTAPASAQVRFGQPVDEAQITTLDGNRAPFETVNGPSSLALPIGGSVVAVELSVP